MSALAVEGRGGEGPREGERSIARGEQCAATADEIDTLHDDITSNMMGHRARLPNSPTNRFSEAQ